MKHITVDKIGLCLYIPDFYRMQDSRLLREASPKEWKDYVQANIKRTARVHGVPVKRDTFLDADRIHYRSNPPGKEKVLGVYWGFEYRRVVDLSRNGFKQKRVLVYYILAWDNQYGLVSFRVSTWTPMLSYAYYNIHEYLRQYCIRHNIEHTAFKNSFEWVDLSEEVLEELIVEAADLEKLREVAVGWLKRFTPKLACEFQATYSQIEFDCDTFVGERSLLRAAIEKFILRNLPVFKRSVVFSLLDVDRVIVTRNHRWYTPKLINDRVMLLNYSARGLQLKIYPKGRQVRLELTYNKEFLKWISRRKGGLDLKEFREVYCHAKQNFERLNGFLKPVRVTSRLDTPKELPASSLVLKDADVRLLEEVLLKGVGEFKNRDLQEATGLTRNQVYYRLKHKFPRVFELFGRFWRTTRLGFKVVEELLSGFGRSMGVWHKLLSGWSGVTVG